MKLTRKILAIALCILMLAALCAPAMATEPGPYKPSDHAFETYQVFSGTQAEGDTKLADIQWGDGVIASGFLTDIREDPIFGDLFADIEITTEEGKRDLSAKRVAEKIAEQGWAFDSEQAQALARAAYANRTDESRGTEKLPSGYYLVVDKTEGDTYVNIALLQVTSGGSVDTWQKVSAPTVEKKVKDKDDSTGEESDYQDSADYDIGDDVPFKITAKFGMIDHFEKYKAIFHDTLSAGLTYNADNEETEDVNEGAKIMLINPGSDPVDVTEGFTVTSNGTELTIGCNDILALGAKNDCEIVITYTAKLNENAVIGAVGNPNTVKLEYSNNPNIDYNEDGEIIDHTKETPEDKVIVFTYQVVLTKVDKEHNPLTGAQFDLYKKVADNGDDNDYVKVADADVTENGTKFTFTGLDAGTYRLVETETPAGYNSIDPIEFTISADHEASSDNPKLLELTCTVDDYDSEMDVAPSLNVKETEEGEYTGTILGDIVNVAGLVLPETGGRGTTIFYAVGSLIVLCAVVGLVAKKRMEGIA